MGDWRSRQVGKGNPPLFQGFEAEPKIRAALLRLLGNVTLHPDKAEP